MTQGRGMYAATSARPGLSALAATPVRRGHPRPASTAGIDAASSIDQVASGAMDRRGHATSSCCRTRRRHGGQLMWIAFCDAGPGCSSREPHEPGAARVSQHLRRRPTQIHVVVPRGAKSLRTRRRRRPRVTTSAPDARSSTVQRLPCIESAVSVIDAAAWQPYPRFAVTMLAAAVQQRFVTVEQLDDALRIVGRVRHKHWMRLALLDIAGGAESLGEIDVAKLCRDISLHAAATAAACAETGMVASATSTANGRPRSASSCWRSTVPITWT